MTSSLTLALTSNLNLTSISKYAPTPTPTTPSISMSMTPPMPMLKTSSQGVGPPLILPNQSDVNVDTASISARSQDPDSTSLAPSTSHASTSRGHAPSDPFFSSASSSSSSAAHPLPSTSGSTPLRPTSRRPTVRSASKPPRRPRSSSGSSSMYTTTKRPRTVADISPSSPARDLLRPRPGLGLGNGLGPAIGLGLAPRPGQALGPRRRSHPWTNSPYSHDRTSISHIGSASPTSRDVRYLSPATGARTLSRLSPLSHHHQAQPQDSHHHPARPQSLDSSSPSGIRSRSASPLEPIPTLAFPPLTLPQPEDPTVLTLGLPQPSATTSGFTFTREDLHSAAVEKHHDEDDDDNENEHGNGNDMGGHMVQNRARSQSQSQIGVTPLKPRDDRMVLVEAAWRRWEETGWLSRGMGAIGARAFDKKGEPYKPNISQVTMIRLVLAASPLKKLPIKQIYEAVSERWPAFRMGDNTWKPFPPRQRQEGFVTPVLDTRYASSLSDPNVPATNHLVSLSPTTLCPCHQPPRVPAPRPVPAPNHSPALTTHRSHHSPRSPPHRARAHSPQNSIRHQLSLQDYFVLEDRPPEEGGNGKGGYWRVKVGVSGVSHWYFAVNEYLLAFVLHYIAHRYTLTSSTPSYSTYSRGEDTVQSQTIYPTRLPLAGHQAGRPVHLQPPIQLHIPVHAQVLHTEAASQVAQTRPGTSPPFLRAII
ncbi:hypothetical protein EHS25_007074 [Saitozyma podzolica]|uniref:Fork-head domain-containing protein n=1 Tax=Saitozyma podzolica TaxID=1890683 RepID=A0A427XPH9_9TREE|nr:hypothetical protein EHS25_007074 [Saitozyma podzolica]